MVYDIWEQVGCRLRPRAGWERDPGDRGLLIVAAL